MSNLNMGANSGKGYQSDGVMVNWADSFHGQRKAAQITKNDCNDQSIPRIVNIGNFGSALQADIGLTQANAFTVSVANFTNTLVPLNKNYDFVFVSLSLIFKSNTEVLGSNKVIKIEGYKDGVKIFDQQYVNLLHLCSLGSQFTLTPAATRVQGTVYDLYVALIELCGDVGGLVLRGADYFKIGAYNATDPNNLIPAQLDIPVATGAIHGYLIEC